MAKRRNLKKEKAERNRAYARQFRSYRSSSQKQRFSRYGQRQGPSDDSSSSSAEGD